MVERRVDPFVLLHSLHEGGVSCSTRQGGVESFHPICNYLVITINQGQKSFDLLPCFYASMLPGLHLRDQGVEGCGEERKARRGEGGEGGVKPAARARSLATMTLRPTIC